MTDENNLPLIANIGEHAESIGEDLSNTLLFREFLEALVRIAHFMNIKTVHMVSADLFSLSKWFIEQKIIAYFRAIVYQKSSNDNNIIAINGQLFLVENLPDNMNYHAKNDGGILTYKENGNTVVPRVVASETIPCVGCWGLV